MTTPSGAISFSDLQAEFGGANPISLNEYYANNSLVANTVAGIPASGTITMDQMRNKQQRKAHYVTYASNVQNAAIDYNGIPGYIAGRTDLFVTINAGVTIHWTSGNYGAAFWIFNGAAGDTLSFTNNGQLLGMGGTGGEVTYDQTANTFSAPAPGNGGAGLILSMPFQGKIWNYGNILGGGGGGGAAGGAFKSEDQSSLASGGGGQPFGNGGQIHHTGIVLTGGGAGGLNGTSGTSGNTINACFWATGAGSGSGLNAAGGAGGTTNNANGYGPGVGSNGPGGGGAACAVGTNSYSAGAGGTNSAGGNGTSNNTNGNAFCAGGGGSYGFPGGNGAKDDWSGAVAATGGTAGSCIHTGGVGVSWQVVGTTRGAVT